MSSRVSRKEQHNKRPNEFTILLFQNRKNHIFCQKTRTVEYKHQVSTPNSHQSLHSMWIVARVAELAIANERPRIAAGTQIIHPYAE